MIRRVFQQLARSICYTFAVTLIATISGQIAAGLAAAFVLTLNRYVVDQEHNPIFRNDCGHANNYFAVQFYPGRAAALLEAAKSRCRY